MTMYVHGQRADDALPVRHSDSHVRYMDVRCMGTWALRADGAGRHHVRALSSVTCMGR
jgi:hypothetical protein